MNYIDLIILFIALVSSLTFMFLGIQRVFNMYIGFILGFFIFLSLSLKIEILDYTPIDSLSFTLKNLYENKDFYLSLSVITLPIYGIVFSILSPKSDRSLIAGGLFGFLLPFLFIGILAYIGNNLGNDFYLNELFYNYFIVSVIFDFFSNNILIFFYLLFFLIFGKALYYILKILGHFIKWYFLSIYNWFVNKKEQKIKK